MIDIVYRFDPEHHHKIRQPSNAAEARRELEEGNRIFASLSLKPGEHIQCVVPFDPFGGAVDEPGDTPAQQPFAAVLGCSDARVPTEMVFSQGSNELFVVRVAGNVLGSECLGSLSYATHHFESLKLIVVLGHRHCGAVKAAVDAFIVPSHYLPLAANQALRTIVDRIMVIVRTAAVGLDRNFTFAVRENPGYPAALTEVTVLLNAAWTAFSLREEFRRHDGHRPEVRFGVYDLVSRHVGLPLSPAGPDHDRGVGLFEPPSDAAGFEELGRTVIRSELVRGLLNL
jgi:carbonic anhydrase